ncbi:hypothetical protein [Pandoraea sp.]|uniref:hypothetical protein n=1 Tax=Pandoraea sp. TaxID=1883445 RepID=UPI001212BA18|nr:hypothetical protein [Pandoraea sp.]TAL54870.1 MAG: hypothetical protein EPN80_10325 [Pandoraea sp.]TAM18362.1 MAG: hypothetical protein EPN65_06315 [Pandoraea sp.]
MKYTKYQDLHYHVSAVQRDNARWDAFYEILQPTDTGLKKVRTYQVQTAYGFESRHTALDDAERNARADIEQGIVRFH